MRKTITVLLVLFLCNCFIASAQNKTITGRVQDQNAAPVPNATILVKGTTKGTAAGANGKFTILASTGDVLVVSAIGFDTATVTIGTKTDVIVTLHSQVVTINDVVVTALGIQRKRNTLPYAAQVLDSSEITKTRTDNFANALSGKVAGLYIKNNNNLGGSTNIVLRGYKSITGNNQAFIVVDGIPVNNNNYNSPYQQQGFGGYDYGNVGADINPDDIESVNVLKGAAATALYGSRAANGVIMITTKKGRRSLGVSINIGGSTGWMDKSTWINYQHQYGAGYYDPDYYTYSDAPPSPNGHFWYFDANDDVNPDLVVPTTEDASFGAKFDPNLSVYQWDAFDPTSPSYLKPTPWAAAKNDPTSFFQHPYTYNASVFVEGGGERAGFKLGYTRNHDAGILPNSRVIKDLVNLQAGYNITNQLTATIITNFSKINGLGRYGTGYDALNIATNFREWWQMNVDMQDLKNAYFRTRNNVTWNMSDPPEDISPIFWDNPYYIRYESYENDSRYRFISSISLNYTATSWLSILGRISLDAYNGLQEERRGIQSVSLGAYSKYNQTYHEYNYDFIANLNKDIRTNLNFKALLGANFRKNYFNSIFAITNGGLIIPGIYSLANSLNPVEAPTEVEERRETGGVFAGITLTYKDMLIFDATGRNDKSSTLPENNNSYFYPSVSGGFVFSKLLRDVSWLSFGKLRVNYAEVGDDAPFDYITDTYDQPTPFGGIPLFSVSTTQKNSDLKPERTRSYEAGIEVSFLKGRIGLDATVFHTNTIDQIIPATSSASTGFTTQIINAGNVQNKGIELSLSFVPVKTQNFSWNMTVNWTKMYNKVLSLIPGTDNILLGYVGGGAGVTLNAAVGQPFGVLRGSDFVYDSAMHQKFVDADGYYEETPSTNHILGNINPDWIGGVNNAFTYKNISLSFLIDVRKGSDIFSVDQWFGQATGLVAFTAGLNDKGNPIRDLPSDGGGVLFPGVTEDGKPNTTYALITGLRGYGYNNFPHAGYVYDGSYVKLREVNVTYSLPAKLVSRLKQLKGIDISVFGRNLWIIHKNLPDADPEDGPSSGNIQGFQVGSYPAYRTGGFNISVTF